MDTFLELSVLDSQLLLLIGYWMPGFTKLLLMNSLTSIEALFAIVLGSDASFICLVLSVLMNEEALIDIPLSGGTVTLGKNLADSCHTIHSPCNSLMKLSLVRNSSSFDSDLCEQWKGQSL